MRVIDLHTGLTVITMDINRVPRLTAKGPVSSTDILRSKTFQTKTKVQSSTVMSPRNKETYLTLLTTE